MVLADAALPEQRGCATLPLPGVSTAFVRAKTVPFLVVIDARTASGRARAAHGGATGAVLMWSKSRVCEAFFSHTILLSFFHRL